MDRPELRKWIFLAPAACFPLLLAGFFMAKETQSFLSFYMPHQPIDQ